MKFKIGDKVVRDCGTWREMEKGHIDEVEGVYKDNESILVDLKTFGDGHCETSLSLSLDIGKELIDSKPAAVTGVLIGANIDSHGEGDKVLGEMFNDKPVAAPVLKPVDKESEMIRQVWALLGDSGLGPRSQARVLKHLRERIAV